MDLTVEHVTTYRYSRSVTESYTIVHLHPRTAPYQFCTRYELEIVPDTRWFEYVDRFGNTVQHFAVIPEHDELRIVARSEVVTLPRAEPHDTQERRPGELHEFLQASPFVALDPEVRRVAEEEVPAGTDDLAAYFFAAGKYVHDTFTYVKGSTTVRTPVGEALRTRTGVCQDYAHVLIALTRARGIPARYASGYIFAGDDGITGAEASHAWAEAYLPGRGWVGFDPTNDRVVDDTFVLVALGRDYGDVSPTRGLFRGFADGELSVEVAIGTNADQQ
jgi:transglutaminase-like putative cysteine protease